MKNKFSTPLLFVMMVNFILFITKLYISIHTNNLCIYTDSINNLLDAVSALLGFFGALLILKAPTKHFPFGFGRMEYFIEFVMATLIVLTSFMFAYNSVQRLLMPVPVWFYVNYAYIISATCLVKILLGILFYFKYKKSKSGIYKTVMLDSFLDCSVTITALVSFTLSNKVNFALDAILGLFISLIILSSGIKLLVVSISKLLGTEQETLEQNIREELNSFQGRMSIENIGIHDYGVQHKVLCLTVSLKSNVDIIQLEKQITSTILEKYNMQTFMQWRMQDEKNKF